MNWMQWQPGEPQKFSKSPKSEPTKPTKPNFVGFVGSTFRQNEKIEVRLAQAGLRIAIDKKTGVAFLIFSDSEAETVRNVADVYKPDVELTDRQRRELDADLEYYEGLLRRQKGQET